LLPWGVLKIPWERYSSSNGGITTDLWQNPVQFFRRMSNTSVKVIGGNIYIVDVNRSKRQQLTLTATNRRSDESRTTASALPFPSCYIVDDVTRPDMAYTEYSLIILSHIVLAKFAITSREMNILIAIDFPCKLIVSLNRVT
jgi:hypothetical protein